MIFALAWIWATVLSGAKASARRLALRHSLFSISVRILMLPGHTGQMGITTGHQLDGIESQTLINNRRTEINFIEVSKSHSHFHSGSDTSSSCGRLIIYVMQNCIQRFSFLSYQVQMQCHALSKRRENRSELQSSEWRPSPTVEPQSVQLHKHSSKVVERCCAGGEVSCKWIITIKIAMQIAELRETLADAQAAGRNERITQTRHMSRRVRTL